MVIEDKIHIEFEMGEEMSPKAKKKSIDYYELKVQLRFSYFNLFEENELVNFVGDNGKEQLNFEDYVTRVGQKVLSKFEGINKVEEVSGNIGDKGIKKGGNKEGGGFDFYFASSGEVGSIIRYFERNYFCEIKQSKKIVGRDSLAMRDIYRQTLLVNILNLEKGDIVTIKGIKYVIKSFNKKEIVLRDFESGAKKIVTYSIVKEYFELIEKSK